MKPAYLHFALFLGIICTSCKDSNPVCINGTCVKITCVQYTCTLIYNGKLDSFLLSLISINVFAKLDDLG